jgi:copper transport protein
MRLTRRLLVALLALLGGAAVVVAVAAPASAHAVLESTSPQAGGAVATAPKRIQLNFGESVEAALGAIRLFDSGGKEIDVSASRHPSGRPQSVVADVPELGNGSYVVAWRVVSADSHPVNGAFTFVVGTGSASGNAQGLVSKLVNSTGSHTVGVLLAVVRWAGFAAIALAIGGLAFAAEMWRGEPLLRARRGLERAAAAGVVVSLLAIAFQGAYAAGLGIGSVVRPSLWWDVATTRFGHAHLVRVVLFVAVIGLARAWDRMRTGGWRAAAVLASIGLALTVSFAGHADTGRWIALGMSADVVHVLAFSVWIGGLWGLLAWALRDGEVADVTAAARRFSTSALVAVVLVAVSGGLQGWRQVGTLGALTSTTYGWLLIVKVGIVVVVVGVAVVSRSLVRAMAAPTEPADLEERVLVGAGAAAPPAPATTVGGGDDVHDVHDDEPVAAIARRYLRRSVGIEVVGVVAVLVLSTLLSSVIPAREAEGLPFDQTVVTDQGFAQFTVDPAKSGTTAIHVTVSNADGTVPTVQEMTVTLRLPERDLGPIDVPMTRLATNHYVNDTATIPFPGTWQITANARVSDFDQLTFTVTVPVR